MRLLKVKGVGRISKRPDLIVIQIDIVSEGMKYNQVISELNERSTILKQDLVKIGFSKDDLKTMQFIVETQYQYIEGKKIFAGFKAVHGLELTFDYNQVLLNQVLKTVAGSKANPLFKILFEVKDKEGFKVELLDAAVQNAKKNAMVIANSASIKLGKIMNIHYNDKTIIPRAQVMLENTQLTEANIDITPKDVEEKDSVHIEWEIEDFL